MKIKLHTPGRPLRLYILAQAVGLLALRDGGKEGLVLRLKSC